MKKHITNKRLENYEFFKFINPNEIPSVLMAIRECKETKIEYWIREYNSRQFFFMMVIKYRATSNSYVIIKHNPDTDPDTERRAFKKIYSEQKTANGNLRAIKKEMRKTPGKESMYIYTIKKITEIIENQNWKYLMEKEIYTIISPEFVFNNHRKRK